MKHLDFVLYFVVLSIKTNETKELRSKQLKNIPQWAQMHTDYVHVDKKG